MWERRRKGGPEGYRANRADQAAAAMGEGSDRHGSPARNTHEPPANRSTDAKELPIFP